MQAKTTTVLFNSGIMQRLEMNIKKVNNMLGFLFQKMLAMHMDVRITVHSTWITLFLGMAEEIGPLTSYIV